VYGGRPISVIAVERKLLLALRAVWLGGKAYDVIGAYTASTDYELVTNY
jgi:hypothetical protein